MARTRSWFACHVPACTGVYRQNRRIRFMDFRLRVGSYLTLHVDATFIDSLHWPSTRNNALLVTAIETNPRTFVFTEAKEATTLDGFQIWHLISVCYGSIWRFNCTPTDLPQFYSRELLVLLIYMRQGRWNEDIISWNFYLAILCTYLNYIYTLRSFSSMLYSPRTVWFS